MARRAAGTFTIVEEPFPKTFPPKLNARDVNEVVFAFRLSELDSWKQLADRLGRPWFITAEQRMDEVNRRLLRTFVLYVKGGIAARDEMCGNKEVRE